MNGLGRGKYLVKGLVQSSGKVTGEEICLEDCSTCLLGEFYEPGAGVTIVAEHTTGNVIAEKLVYTISALLSLQLVQIGSLPLAEYLNRVVAELHEKKPLSGSPGLLILLVVIRLESPERPAIQLRRK